MGRPLQSEVTAIQQLRAKFPTLSQGKLAKKIAGADFAEFSNRTLARNALGNTNGRTRNRSYLSIYSVIRRFDAKNKPAEVLAAGGPTY